MLELSIYILLCVVSKFASACFARLGPSADYVVVNVSPPNTVNYKTKYLYSSVAMLIDGYLYCLLINSSCFVYVSLD
jgi:hypothetical protein